MERERQKERDGQISDNKEARVREHVGTRDTGKESHPIKSHPTSIKRRDDANKHISSRRITRIIFLLFLSSFAPGK